MGPPQRSAALRHDGPFGSQAVLAATTPRAVPSGGRLAAQVVCSLQRPPAPSPPVVVSPFRCREERALVVVDRHGFGGAVAHVDEHAGVAHRGTDAMGDLVEARGARELLDQPGDANEARVVGLHRRVLGDLGAAELGCFLGHLVEPARERSDQRTGYTARPRSRDAGIGPIGQRRRSSRMYARKGPRALTKHNLGRPLRCECVSCSPDALRGLFGRSRAPDNVAEHHRARRSRRASELSTYAPGDRALGDRREGTRSAIELLETVERVRARRSSSSPQARGYDRFASRQHRPRRSSIGSSALKSPLRALTRAAIDLFGPRVDLR